MSRMSDEEYYQWQEDKAATEKAERDAAWAECWADRDERDRQHEEWLKEKSRRREQEEQSSQQHSLTITPSPRPQATYLYRAYVVWVLFSGFASIYLSLGFDSAILGIQNGVTAAEQATQVVTFAGSWLVTSLVGIWAIRIQRRRRSRASGDH